MDCKSIKTSSKSVERLFYPQRNIFLSRAPTVKVSDKVMIPQEEHPDINFVGLLIGEFSCIQNL